MLLIPHELKFEHALMNTTNLKIVSNVIINEWEVSISDNSLKYSEKEF